jgi:acetyltransferase-like isoleucine patch superfamily enzyme
LRNVEFLADVIIGIGNVSIRQKIIKEIKDLKNLNFPTFIHPKASLYDSDSIQIGKGCYIGESSILTTDINVEDFCFINSNVSIHHDSIIRENCVIMPGV